MTKRKEKESMLTSTCKNPIKVQANKPFPKRRKKRFGEIDR